MTREKRTYLKTVRRVDERDPRQRPFPFAKGPLLAFDASLARWLTNSSHALEEQRRIRAVRSSR